MLYVDDVGDYDVFGMIINMLTMFFVFQSIKAGCFRNEGKCD